MKVIYEPKGAAYEYAPLAANLRLTCGHRCDYPCYAPGALHKAPDAYHVQGPPRPGILEALECDATRMAKHNDRRRVCFGFVGDVYAPEEFVWPVTRQALEIMVWHGLLFEVITKGGTRACRDFDLLKQGGRLGVSLVWASQFHVDAGETGTASIDDRVESLCLAHEAGIYTWQSVEPVQRINEALAIMEQTLPFVDEYRIGKRKGDPEYHEDCWPDFLADALDMLSDAGKKWMVKDSLQKYLRGRPATGPGVAP
jgi:DNA repair photolyase